MLGRADSRAPRRTATGAAWDRREGQGTPASSAFHRTRSAQGMGSLECAILELQQHTAFFGDFRFDVRAHPGDSRAELPEDLGKDLRMCLMEVISTTSERLSPSRDKCSAYPASCSGRARLMWKSDRCHCSISVPSATAAGNLANRASPLIARMSGLRRVCSSRWRSRSSVTTPSRWSRPRRHPW